MSRYFAFKHNPDGTLKRDPDGATEVYHIIWRQFPKEHPYREFGWWRVYWGEHEIAWLTPGRWAGWDVLLLQYGRTEENNQEFSELSKMGKGFATRWHATEYVLKCVGIWPRNAQ